MAAKIHTHYDNLKVARNAPPEIIRAAYKTLSKKYHPDHNPGNPEAIRIIQLINSAYDVLSDPARRQEHDRWIAQEETRQEFASRSDYSPRFNASATRPPVRAKSSHHAGRTSSADPLRKLAMLFGHLFKSFYRRT